MSDALIVVSRDLMAGANVLLDKATAVGISPTVVDKLFERYDRMVSLAASANLIVLAAQAGLPSGKAFAMAFDAYMIEENASPGSARGNVLWGKLMEQMTRVVDDASALSAVEVNKIQSDAAARKIEAVAAKYKSDQEADAARRKSQWESKSYIGRLFWGVS
jgi:hypothetical protein